MSSSFGGESASDPEHHRFGGVLVSGLRTDDRDTDDIGKVGVEVVNGFAAQVMPEGAR